MDLLVHTEGLGTHLQVGLHLVLVTRVALDDVPVARQLLQGAHELAQAGLVGLEGGVLGGHRGLLPLGPVGLGGLGSLSSLCLEVRDGLLDILLGGGGQTLGTELVGPGLVLITHRWILSKSVAVVG